MSILWKDSYNPNFDYAMNCADEAFKEYLNENLKFNGGWFAKWRLKSGLRKKFLEEVQESVISWEQNRGKFLIASDWIELLDSDPIEVPDEFGKGIGYLLGNLIGFTETLKNPEKRLHEMVIRLNTITKENGVFSHSKKRHFFYYIKKTYFEVYETLKHSLRGSEKESALKTLEDIGKRMGFV